MEFFRKWLRIFRKDNEQKAFADPLDYDDAEGGDLPRPERTPEQARERSVYLTERQRAAAIADRREREARSRAAHAQRRSVSESAPGHVYTDPFPSPVLSASMGSSGGYGSTSSWSGGGGESSGSGASGSWDSGSSSCDSGSSSDGGSCGGGGD